MWKRFLLLFFVFGLSASCFGASVNWNASIVDAEHGAPDGYRVYYGYTADQLTTAYDVGTELNFPIPETWNPATYYFGVRAYNASGESGWATTPEGQTWVSYVKSEPPPVLPPAPATDVRIVWEPIEEPPVMAAAIDSYGYSVQTSNSGSVSISVPSGISHVAIFFSGFTWSSNTMSTISLGGSSATILVNNYREDFMSGVAVLESPSSGSKSLAWDISGTNNGELILVYVFLTGTEDVIDYGFANETSGYSTISTVIDSSNDSVVIGICTGISETYTDAAPAGSGQTVIISAIDGGDWSWCELAEEDSPGSSTTSFSGISEWGGVVAISFSASGGGASAVPKIMLLQDHFSGGVH